MDSLDDLFDRELGKEGFAEYLDFKWTLSTGVGTDMFEALKDALRARLQSDGMHVEFVVIPNIYFGEEGLKFRIYLRNVSDAILVKMILGDEVIA